MITIKKSSITLKFYYTEYNFDIIIYTTVK